MAVPGPMVSGGLGVQVGCGGREVGAAGPSVMGTGVGCQWGQGWGGNEDGVAMGTGGVARGKGWGVNGFRDGGDKGSGDGMLMGTEMGWQWGQ